MDTNPRINVAITGTLSEPRSKVAQLINATQNGRFVEYLNLETHYLVCEKHDSQKARKASQYGTAVIPESELRDILVRGEFPSIELPTYTPHQAHNFPEIVWREVFEPARLFILTYRDIAGAFSVRTIALTGRGSDGTHDWLGAYDGPKFKTFRGDRVIHIEEGTNL